MCLNHRVYQDGVQTGSDVTQSNRVEQPGEGRVVLGREYTNKNGRYGSVDLDELILFNQALSVEQIWDIKNIPFLPL